MVKVSYQDIPDELERVANKSFQQRDRYIRGVVQSQPRLLPKRKKRELSRVAKIASPMQSRGSMFKYLSPLWRALSSGEKKVWADAGKVSGLNGWQLFVSDSAARFKNYLDLGELPSDLWQVRTGKIKIDAPASSILIKQSHPYDYWITSKIRGKAWKSELKLLREYFSLPLTLKIRYKSNMISLNPDAFAKFYAIVLSSYQGVDRENKVEINLNLNTDWTFAEATLDKVSGYIMGYTLFLEVKNARGEILMDNLRAEHSGQNWVRDPRCDDVAKIFKKQFQIVKPFWEIEDEQAGASFLSVFPPAL